MEGLGYYVRFQRKTRKRFYRSLLLYGETLGCNRGGGVGSLSNEMPHLSQTPLHPPHLPKRIKRRTKRKTPASSTPSKEEKEGSEGATGKEENLA